MTTRTDVIAGVLRRPVLHRPVLGHELREGMVQGLGPGSTVARWTATVPQLADAIDVELFAHDARALTGSLTAGHALVIECHGPDLVGTCQCGRVLGRIDAGTRLDALAVPWIRHTVTGLAAARASA